MTSPSWAVEVTVGAYEDLKRLRKKERKAWREAIGLIDLLEHSADSMGEPCHPPLPEGVRRVHFWNDQYRLVWRIDAACRRAEVWATGRKDGEGLIYEKARARIEDSTADAEE